jgi:hypothetical protein
MCDSFPSFLPVATDLPFNEQTDARTTLLQPPRWLPEKVIWVPTASVTVVVEVDHLVACTSLVAMTSVESFICMGA